MEGLVKRAVKKAKSLICGPSDGGLWGPELTEYLRLCKVADDKSEEDRKLVCAAKAQIPMNEWAAYLRKERRPLFKPQNARHDRVEKHTSPSGRYSLTITPFKTGEKTWDYTRGTVRSTRGNVAITTVYRNYSSFWHTWIEHPNGKEYLFCGEDYQGYTMIDLDAVALDALHRGGSHDGPVNGRWDYLPSHAKMGIGWCTASMAPSPDGTIIAAEGCYWACPYDLRFYDFSEPEKGLPLKLIDTVDAQERVEGWVDNDTFVYTEEIEVVLDGENQVDRYMEELDDDEWDELYEKHPERVGYKLKTYRWRREEVPIVQELTDALDAWGEAWEKLNQEIEGAEEDLEAAKVFLKDAKEKRKEAEAKKWRAELVLCTARRRRKEMRDEQGRLWRVRALIQEGQLGQSRWGYHSCKYDHYRKLKFLNHKLMQAQIKQAAYERYWRKLPHNRVTKRYERNEKGWKIGYTTRPMKEPQLCPVFSKEEVGSTREGMRDRMEARTKGHLARVAHLKDRVVWTVDPGIIKDYWNTLPKEKPSELMPLTLSVEEVDALVAKFPDNPWGLVDGQGQDPESGKGD